jgi:nickel-dependent lactate racemase
MEKNYYLYLSQDKKEYFTLPAGWVPLHFVEAEESALTPSIEKLTLEALSRPTGTAPFQEMLSGVKNIAIIVDDGTRPTPVAKIVGVVFPF